MSAAAWRLSREERVRSGARVAALAAAASDHGEAAGEAASARVPEPQVVRVPESQVIRVQEPQLEWAPVAVNESKPATPWAPARVSPFPSEAPERRPAKPAVEDPVGDAFLGSAIAAPSSGGRQRGLAIAACFLFLIVVTGGYWTIYGDDAGSVTAAASANTAPLELASLRHERRGSRLSISGLVRNPAGGAPVERLTAVVFLFDQQSAFVTSARADVDFTRLTPGDESPFVIAVDAPASVARYRVSFRNEAGVVPHVDRRGQEPIARELK
jgi:hypothetical protein